MFAVMPGLLEISSLAHQQFLDIQKQLFEGLDIHFKVLDMPPDELGHPAYRKYDIEVSVSLISQQISDWSQKMDLLHF